MEARLPRGVTYELRVERQAEGEEFQAKRTNSLVYMYAPPPGLELWFTHFRITSITGCVCIQMHSTTHVYMYVLCASPALWELARGRCSNNA